jgi:hypothetical protein
MLIIQNSSYNEIETYYSNVHSTENCTGSSAIVTGLISVNVV